MIRGLYTATSGMLANERMQEVISNNIANANTTGYKADDGVLRSFPEELLLRLNDNKGGPGSDTKNIGGMSNGTVLEEVLPRYVQGAVTESDNPQAYAIIDTPKTAQNQNQRSYFPVLVGNETMYTRDGDFRVQSGTNFLSTSAGDPVLPIDQATGLPMTNLRIQVQADGSYRYTDAQGAVYRGRQVPAQGIVDIQDSTKLNKYGANYYQGGQVVRGTGQMENGHLEQSNVDLASSMVSMMSVLRSYEANQRMIKTMDDSLSKAISIGKL